MINKKFQPKTLFFLIMWCVALVYFPSADAASAVPTIHKSHLTRDWSGAYNVFFDNDDIENGSWIEDDKDSKPEAFKVQQWYPEGAELLKPRLKTFPEKYVYDGHAYFELLCEADLKKGDQLIWYIVFLNDEGVVRGNKIIIYNEKEDHAANKTLILKLPVFPYVNNTNYYCYRARTGSEIEYTYSNNLTIVLPENDQLLMPTLLMNRNSFRLGTTASDNSDIYYNDTTPILINCFGGYAELLEVDDVGSFVTWYQVQD
ncbi:uncharacterized protein LOC134678026 [Cydia fagiglandana]|uniref:uncharacterized protein LOC134678026 n=1 Tax=Cydia fagiglandana TaxID=1458189 RepID=UPI002FEDFE8D